MKSWKIPWLQHGAYGTAAYARRLCKYSWSLRANTDVMENFHTPTRSTEHKCRSVRTRLLQLALFKSLLLRLVVFCHDMTSSHEYCWWAPC